MKTLQNIKFYFVILCLTSIWLMVRYFKMDYTIKTNNVIISQKDSIIDDLKFELLVKEIDLGRYEIILEKIREKNPNIVDDAEQQTE